MARNNQRGRRNNNPEGRNQYSSGWMDTARERPIAAAATAAAAVGAGVFLWSRRNQISDQLSNLSDQISDWTENMRSGSEQGRVRDCRHGTELQSSTAQRPAATSSRTSRSTGSRTTSTGSGNRSTRGMSETGGGNASLGAHSGTTAAAPARQDFVTPNRKGAPRGAPFSLLLPAALLAAVLLLEPGLQRREIFEHRLGRHLAAAGERLKRIRPRLRGAHRQHLRSAAARLPCCRRSCSGEAGPSSRTCRRPPCRTGTAGSARGSSARRACSPGCGTWRPGRSPASERGTGGVMP